MTVDRVVVLDFEATCDDVDPPVPQEVIEFPSVLVDLRAGAIVDRFEAFVRPLHHPVLRPFCTALTSITQADVDGAEPFPAVFEAHQRWLRGHGIRVETEDPGEDAPILTCGDWDLSTLLPRQLAACAPPIGWVPRIYRSWINVKRPFATSRAGPPTGMPGMLEALGLELEGRHHRGLDDCLNIARIALTLAAQGVALEPTTTLSRSRYAPVRLVLVRGAAEATIELRRRTVAGLLGAASTAFRAGVTRAFDERGRPIDADAVLDLREGQRLRVS